jgi:hypothetical protein
MIAANLDLRDPCHGPRGGQFDADEVDSELGLKSRIANTPFML